jgi:two-component system chemotaxis sensor kinase CheA
MDMSDYLSIFIDEANEHLQALNENLLKLEEAPDELGIVQEIFRSAHTLKGMAASMGFEDMAALTHKMENVLDLVRNSKLRMNEMIFDTMFQGLDSLSAMVADITAGGAGVADVADLVARLAAISSGEAETAAATVQPAASAVSVLDLDEFQQSILKQSLDSGLSAYRIEVTLRQDCVLKAARAYMVFGALEQEGEIIKSVPGVEEIEQEKFDRSFTLYHVTHAEPEPLQEKILHISEIERVDIRPIGAADLEKHSHARMEEADDARAAAGEIASEAAVKTQPRKGTGKSAAHGTPVQSRTIRVDIERLDALMNLFSELLIDRVRLEQLSGDIKRDDLTETVEHLSRISSDLQNIILKLRMVPVDTVFNRFPRMVRDLAKSLNKKLELVISGADTELDRTVIDEIGDPLVHLLRNSVDHGIESPERRIAAGKPETGTVHLRAYHSGNHVFIEIEDDGGGIQRDKVLKKALEKGIVTPDEAGRMTDEQVYDLLFASGFSTADQITDVSGRGVGLDVVRSKIESLGGKVSVQSAPGQGTKFSVQLPLTLSIISAMLVQLGSEKYAIPLSSIVETAIIRQSQIKNVHGNRIMDYRDRVLPVMSLSRILEVPDYDDSAEEETEMVIIRKGEQMAGLLVDSFIGQSEIVIKTLGKYLQGSEAVSGAAILGDGQVSLILDPNALIK